MVLLPCLWLDLQVFQILWPSNQNTMTRWCKCQGGWNRGRMRGERNFFWTFRCWICNFEAWSRDCNYPIFEAAFECKLGRFQGLVEVRRWKCSAVQNAREYLKIAWTFLFSLREISLWADSSVFQPQERGSYNLRGHHRHKNGGSCLCLANCFGSCPWLRHQDLWSE